jgi:vancomycin resistance protein YoaR
MKTKKTSSKKPADEPQNLETTPDTAKPNLAEEPRAAEKPQAPRSTKKLKKEKPARTSALDAAAKVLAEANGEAMSTQRMIELMAEKGYWKSPGGQTPHATLYSAILREIEKKGREARFQKLERGKFVLVAK